MTIKDLINNTFGNFGFWGLLVAVILIIALGFLFQRKKFLTNNWEKIIVKIVVYLALPLMVFNSFLVDIDSAKLTEAFVSMGIGIIYATLATFGSHFFFYKVRPSAKISLAMVVAFPSALYFGYPILAATFPGKDKELLTMSSMFLVSFHVFLATAALYYFKKPILDKQAIADDLNKEKYKYKFSWENCKAIVLNPILIATTLGFILWISQLIPGIAFVPNLEEGGKMVSITRIDAYIPGVGKLLSTLGALASPLAWFAIGAVIAKSDLIVALKNKIVWYTVFIKNMLIPFLTLLLVSLFAWIGYATGGFQISTMLLMLLVAIIASPTATAIVGYAIVYEREPTLVSEATSLTILASIVTLPFWVIVSGLIGISIGIFGAI
ncbi:AEC family transporter [Williamsoniiplasma lucivorax]|uniref:Malate permease n=1 Tax=Williamsoniiplasma lucivorax TaxID=209274 RepID=A0A2S5RA05_9MOLU|nr:AEC family transporter [Williamsoniiplasma lucivorax]PPE04138.1 malate permease [Williamsoniiplasma lucivorax]